MRHAGLPLAIAVLLAGSRDVPGRASASECVPAAGSARLQVSLNLRASGEVAGLHLRLRYPTDRVDLPEGGAVPADRFSRPGPGLLVVNDHDGGVDVVAANAGPLATTPFTVVSFDRCVAAVDPTADQFECTVLDAANPKGEALENVNCAATLVP